MSKQFDPRGTRRIQAAVRGYFGGLGSGGKRVAGTGGNGRYLEGLLTDTLLAPDSFGGGTSVDMQIWCRSADGLTLVQSDPVETVTIYNYDPNLTLNQGAYVQVCAMGGYWSIFYASCPDTFESYL